MRWILFCLAVLPLPAASADVYDHAAATPELAQFAAAMRSTGIDRALGNPGPYTIFAPDNAAFADLPRDLDREKLVQILTCHMVPSRVLTDAAALGRPTTLRTVGGCRLVLARDRDGLVVQDDAGRKHRVTAASAQSNGQVLSIDSLILPTS